MLYVIFQDDMSLLEASTKLNRKVATIPDNEFEFKSRKHDLNKDDFFKKCLLEVGNCDIPMDNVIRYIPTGQTHSFDKVSTGVKTLWLLNNYNNEYLVESCYLGPNCYRLLVELSKDRDVYIYDNSNMMDYEEADACLGCFTDFTRGVVVEFGDDHAFDYFRGRGVNA